MNADLEPAADQPRPRHLRLVWSNPTAPAPRRRIDLAAAIERHLSGGDGLTDEQFLRVFSRPLSAGADWAETNLAMV